MDTVIVLGIIIIILLIVLIVSQVIISTYGTEIKNFISRIRFSKKNKNNNIQFLISFFNDLASVLIKMSNDKIGALIVVENKDSLTPYINIGSKVDVQFFPEFVTSVFYNHKSALHDGAMIIRNWKIVSLSSYLPMTKKIINVEYGARHRAAFGICERFDCFAFVVSETNGNITAVHMDEFKKLSLSPEKLSSEIAHIFSQTGVFNKSKMYRNIDVDKEVTKFNQQNKIKQK